MAKAKGVFLRGGTYWIRYTVAGRQVRQSAETTNKKEAEALLGKIKAEIHAGIFFPEKRRAALTLGELRERYEQHKQRKRSLASDRSRWRNLLEFFGPERPIAEILTADVDQLREALAEEVTRRGAPMSPASVNRHLEILRAALLFADREGFLTRRPTFVMLDEHNARDRICSPEEYERLRDGATSPNLRLAIVLGYWTGMRLGEIVRLRWSAIALPARTVKLGTRDTKTKEARTIPLASEAVEALKAWPRRLKDDRVFALAETSASLSPSFSRLVRRLEIPDLRFHDLRHTAATRLRRAGVDLFTLASITGHKSMDMLRRYNTVTDGDLVQAMRKAEAFEASPTGKPSP